LKNAIERAMILEESVRIRPMNLPYAVQEKHLAAVPPVIGLSLVGHEEELIVEALRKGNGNRSEAARLLGVSRDTLRYRMKKFNLR
jgi:two-component system response regulator AtoC